MNEWDLICVHRKFRHFDGIWGAVRASPDLNENFRDPSEAMCVVSRVGNKKQEEWRNAPCHHFQIT